VLFSLYDSVVSLPRLVQIAAIGKYYLTGVGATPVPLLEYCAHNGFDQPGTSTAAIPHIS